MTYLSIIEKFKILFNTLLDFKFLIVFIVLLLIFTLLYAIKKLSGNKYLLCMSLSFVMAFSISIIINYKVLSNTFDNFVTIFFGNIYFPSIYVYIGVLVISFISFVLSIFNVMLKRIYKVINSIMFVVNNILFVVILNIIAKNKIDIFSTNSLYTNTSLVAILELSMGLFIIWVLALITVYVTNVICDRLSHKKVYNAEVEENIIFNPVLEVNNDMVTNNSVSTDNVLVEVINSSKEEDSNNEIETVSQEVYNIIQDSVAIEEHIPVEETLVNYSNSDSNVTFSDVLNGSIPVTYYDNNVANEEYNLIDPQVIYEDKYNKIKNENIVFNNIEIDLEKDTERDNNKVIFNDVNISLNHDVKEEMDLSVEEATLKVKDRVKEERLIVNTISLNDLIDKEDNKINTVDNSVDNVEVKIEKQNMSVYTIDDYKKIIKMLNELKMHSNDANINIDDAVAISLISNYSIEDCMKFKNILENNLI